jgi:adenylate kinase family enzyme
MMFKHPPKIVLVSGAPGVGKTTLAVPLASALNFTLISKDDIALKPPPNSKIKFCHKRVMV